jgi:4-hydroxybenzoyl-CoA thioesterase
MSAGEEKAMSRIAITTIRVEWGDCDPAGIVYYPNFFHWCDVATWNFFAACGLAINELRSRYGTIGFPLIEASATFRVPSRPQDVLAIATRIGALHSKTLELSHEFSRDGASLLTARELRVWAAPDATHPHGLRARPMPQEVIERLRAARDDAPAS